MLSCLGLLGHLSDVELLPKVFDIDSTKKIGSCWLGDRGWKQLVGETIFHHSGITPL